MFQSLFFWMTPIKVVKVGEANDAYAVSILVLLDDSHQEIIENVCYGHSHVSILVLLDDSHQGPGLAIGALREMAFQSLFFWMTPIKATSWACTCTWTSFNPCSSG